MKLLLLAGEESGVLYANEITERARKAYPGVEIRGFSDYGFETHDLAVMGFTGVIAKLFFFLHVKKTMEKAIEDWRPDVICTVDYPGMNIKLAAYAKRLGIRAVHVVCPQVWAWKAWRIPGIEAALDHLCCFFPFEPRIFKSGLAEFIGHPLAQAFAKEATVSRESDLIALLPGSRKGEIERILPVLLEAVRGLSARVVIPAATPRARKQIEAILKTSDVPVTLQDGGARELLKRAQCAAVASGTATLEAALARCPTALVYCTGAAQAWLLRRMIKGVKHVGLANIIWEKCAMSASEEAPMPELLQENFTSANVRSYLEQWLSDPTARKEAVRRLDAAMVYLTSEGEPLARVVAAFGNVV